MKELKIVCIGDPFVPVSLMKEEASRILPDVPKKIISFTYPLGKNPSKDEFQKTILEIEKNGSEIFELDKEILDETKDATIIMTHIVPLSKNLISNAKNLKLILSSRGGQEHINLETAKQLDIPVLNVFRNTEQTAEYTVALMLSEVRNLAKSHEKLKNGEWVRDFPNSKFTACLSELTVGLLGLGNIGKCTAKKLIGLGVNVIAYDPYLDPKVLEKENLDIKLVSLDELMKEADVISLHLRLGEKTKNFVNKDLIKKMKPTAYLINTARAGLIDEDALIDALQNKKIAGAALDVFWNEPIPQNHPLLKLDNVTISSHLAAETVSAMERSPILLVNKTLVFLEQNPEVVKSLMS